MAAWSMAASSPWLLAESGARDREVGHAVELEAEAVVAAEELVVGGGHRASSRAAGIHEGPVEIEQQHR